MPKMTEERVNLIGMAVLLYWFNHRGKRLVPEFKETLKELAGLENPQVPRHEIEAFEKEFDRLLKEAEEIKRRVKLFHSLLYPPF